MHIEELRDYCISKSGAVEEMPFGPHTLVFKVGNKVFMLLGLDQIDVLGFNVKCNPEYALELRSTYPETVIPGYHMNKKHWNTVYCNKQLSDDRIRELIDHSYDLVYTSLPKGIKSSIR